MIAAALFLTYCTQEAPTFPWSGASYAEVQETAGSRIIQLEFYTDT